MVKQYRYFNLKRYTASKYFKGDKAAANKYASNVRKQGINCRIVTIRNNGRKMYFAYTRK